MTTRLFIQAGKPRFPHLFVFIIGTIILLTSLLSAQSYPDGSRVQLSYTIADLGQDTTISINIVNESGSELSGLDFRIQYDTTGLTFLDANPGQILQDCQWEYFNFSQTDNQISIVAIADMDNGDNHPDCLIQSDSGEIVSLNFHVIDIPENECGGFDINFIWNDCGDNLIYSPTSDILYASDSVMDENANYLWPQDDLPAFAGMPDSCIGGNIIREFDYSSSILFTKCPETLDYGDLNLNGLQYEIADYMVFQNFLLNGFSAFTMKPDTQFLVSDVNLDGKPGRIADYIYMLRVIVGEAVPLDTPATAPVSTDTAYFVQDYANRTVTLTYPDSLAAAQFKFHGSIDVVETQLEDHEIGFSHDVDDTTRVLITDNDYIPFAASTFTGGQIFTYTGDGYLFDADVGDYENSIIPTKIQIINVDVLCGDCNLDGLVNISDAVFLISYIFLGGIPPVPFEGADVNCDGRINISDAVYIVQYIFNGGPVPCADCL